MVPLNKNVKQWCGLHVFSAAEADVMIMKCTKTICIIAWITLFVNQSGYKNRLCSVNVSKSQIQWEENFTEMCAHEKK